MVHKLALAVGGIAAAGILAVVLAATGFGPVAPATVAPATNAVVDPVAQAAVDPTPQATTVTDNVYVAPTPEPQVIRITKPAPVRSSRQPVQAAGQGEGDAAEHDDGGNGD